MKRILTTLLLLLNYLQIGILIGKNRKIAIQNSGSFLRTSFRLQGESNITIGKGSKIRKAKIIIKGKNNRLELGDGVYFSGKIELLGDGNLIKIGSNTHINNATLIANNGTKLEIGSRCLFSSNIDVRTTDSHKIYDSAGECINSDQDIFIGEHVWIGRMVSIMKGAQIGNGSVIGAMSIVTSVIPQKVVAAGVPAKPIKENITWEA